MLGSPEFSKQNVKGDSDEARMAEYWASLADVKATKEFLMQSATLPYEVAGDVLPSDMGSDAFAYKRPMGVMSVLRSSMFEFLTNKGLFAI